MKSLYRWILVLMVASVYWFLGWRLTALAELSTWAASSIWIWLLLLFGYVLALPLYFWNSHNRKFTKRHLQITHIGHLLMAYLNFLIPVVLIRDAVGLIAWVGLGLDLQVLYSANGTLALLLLPFAFKLWGRINISKGPQIIRKEIKDPRLAEEFSGLKILQISDLHISHSLKQGFIESVIEMTQKVNPDVVVLTGDIVDGPAEEFRQEILQLRQLKASRGVFFVPGNHEYYWGYSRIEKVIREAGITVLKNEGNSLKGEKGDVLIAGVPDPAASYFGDEAPKFELFEPIFTDRQYRILLSHQPSLADHAAQKGFHFQFSGHTHAGQFFPWNFLIGLFERYPKGHFRIGEMHLYVNQGTGYWGPALRIGTFCEVTEITLKSS